MPNKYNKLIGKDEISEAKVSKTKSGLVEREKKVVIVEEDGTRKQLLREQV